MYVYICVCIYIPIYMSTVLYFQPHLKLSVPRSSKTVLVIILPRPVFPFCLFIYFYFIYFWLCWVFIAVRGLSPVAVSGGYSSLQCVGFSC